MHAGKELQRPICPARKPKRAAPDEPERCPNFWASRLDPFIPRRWKPAQVAPAVDDRPKVPPSRHPLMLLMAESSRTFISTSAFRSSLPGAYHPPVAGMAARFAGVSYRVCRGMERFDCPGPRVHYPTDASLASGSGALAEFLNSTVVKMKISVADVLEAVGHAFTIRKGEMSSGRPPRIRRRNAIPSG